MNVLAIHTAKRSIKGYVMSVSLKLIHLARRVNLGDAYLFNRNLMNDMGLN